MQWASISHHLADDLFVAGINGIKFGLMFDFSFLFLLPELQMKSRGREEDEEVEEGEEDDGEPEEGEDDGDSANGDDS